MSKHVDFFVSCIHYRYRFWHTKKTVTPQTIQIFRSKVSTMQLDTTAHSQLSSVTNHERICLFFYFFLIAWKQINNNNFAYTKFNLCSKQSTYHGNIILK